MRNGKGKLIYFNDNEWEIISNKSKELNVNTTEYIRKIAVQGFIIDYPISNIRDIIYELNRVGVNINQIAKKANETNSVTYQEVNLLNNEMEKIWLLLDRMLYIKQ